MSSIWGTCQYLNQYTAENQACQKVYDFPEVGYYEIEASGVCGFGISDYEGGPIKIEKYGPTGKSYRQDYQNQLPIPEENVYSLIGKTEESNKFFYIGGKYKVYVSRLPMSLMLTANHLQDSISGPANFKFNTDGWDIKIKKTS